LLSGIIQVNLKQMYTSRTGAYTNQPGKVLQTNKLIENIYIYIYEISYRFVQFLYLSDKRQGSDSSCKCSSTYADAVIGSPTLYSQSKSPVS